MLRGLEFNRRSAGVCSIGGKRQVAVAPSIQELCALVIVEHTQTDVFVWMDLSDIERQPLLEQILSPVKDVHHDRFLWSATLQTIEGKTGAEALTEIELLADADVRSRSHQ